VVANQGMWIEANYKETDLTHVRPGQPVDIRVDTYPGQRWRGTVESLSQTSGSEFSVLPPQNATGNWVKVVQRIPVRIAIQPRGNAPPLRAGMSTVVEIDTGYHRPLPGLVRTILSPLHGFTGSPVVVTAGTGH
jgi:membrane fusion protein (multidrug efflux system)